MKLLKTGFELRTQLESELRDARSVVICSAYVTLQGVNWLLERINPSTSLHVVGRFAPNDFIQGASDTLCLRKLIESGYKVYALKNLHAKMVLLDANRLMIGSANLTGKGYGINETANVEASTFILNVQSSDVDWIVSIVEAAVELRVDHITAMENFISLNGMEIEHKCLEDWPHEVLYQEEILYVRDLPLSGPHEWNEYYGVEMNSDFAKVFKAREDKALARSIFVNSKIFLWLKSIISNKGRTLSFGEVSSLLHDVLADDPKPYRRTVKELQSNLYKFVKLYASDELEVFQPGSWSECIREASIPPKNTIRGLKP